MLKFYIHLAYGRNIFLKTDFLRYNCHTNIKAVHIEFDMLPSSQGYGFPVVIYGFEKWTIKKAEH